MVKTLIAVNLLVFLSINLYSQCLSNGDGDWDDSATWTNCGGGIPGNTDDVVIQVGDDVTGIDGNETIANLTIHGGGASLTLTNNPRSFAMDDLTINSGGTLITGTCRPDIDGSAITVNGTITGDGWIEYNNGGTLDGSGSISFNRFTIRGVSTIPASADLTITATDPVNLGLIVRNTTVTNNGIITLAGVLLGASGTQVWVNASGSTLNVSGGGITLATLTATAATNLINYNGAAIQSVHGTTYYNLTFDGGGAKTLAAAATVTGALTLTSGIVTSTAANLLTLNDGATSTSGNATSFIDGPINKVGNDAFTFPTGDGTKWARIAISAPSSATDEFTAEYFFAAFGDLTTDGSPLTAVSGAEYWDLNQDVGSNGVTVQLFWEDNVVSGINVGGQPSTDYVVASYNLGSIWTSEGQSAIDYSAPAGSITSNSVSAGSFGEFTFGSLTDTEPLPIKLVSFSGQQRESEVLLSWETASEINNDYFTIEKSDNDLEFFELSRIPGAGTSLTSQFYNYLDPTPGKLNYYRLRQTDFDGTFETSEVISVTFKADKIHGNFYPNPFTADNALLEIYNPNQEVISVRFYDQKLQLVWEIKTTGGSIPIESSKFKKGIYFYFLSKNSLLIDSGKIIKID